MSDILTNDEMKYIPIYVRIGNITDTDMKNTSFALIVVEEDSSGFYVSSVNEQMYHTYGGELAKIDSKNFYNVHRHSEHKFPYKYFLIKNGRLEEIPDDVVKMSREL